MSLIRRRRVINNLDFCYKGIIAAYFEQTEVKIGTKVTFHLHTSLNISNIECKNKVGKDALYGELSSEIVGNKIHYYGQIRATQLTLNTFTFIAKDKNDIKIGEIKLTIKITM